MHDRGVRMHDSASIMHDRGVPMHDNGIIINDHGVRMHDHGIIINDRGSRMHDNGIGMNARGTIPCAYSSLNPAQDAMREVPADIGPRERYRSSSPCRSAACNACRCPCAFSFA